MGLPYDSKVRLNNRYKKGELNLITDVPGVLVGQVTKNNSEKNIHTGITAVIPAAGNIFREKVFASSHVINGFGKSAGLIQIEELGTIETPILMTNTFGVGTCLNGLTKYMLENNPEIGVSTGTVNCVVTECNDGLINDIRGMHIKEDDVKNALERAGRTFKEGAEGGGTGMICMGLKGGIGSASRVLTIDNNEYTLGAIVMTNFGVRGNLRIDGEPAEPEIYERRKEEGSCIIIIGTDIPFSERQLKRIAKRSVTGLVRTGSYLGNGSGDVAIAFSNGNRVSHFTEKRIFDMRMFNDDKMDMIFEATAEVVEESVISSLYHSEDMENLKGKTVKGLRSVL